MDVEEISRSLGMKTTTFKTGEKIMLGAVCWEPDLLSLLSVSGAWHPRNP